MFALSEPSWIELTLIHEYFILQESVENLRKFMFRIAYLKSISLYADGLKIRKHNSFSWMNCYWQEDLRQCLLVQQLLIIFL